MNRCPITYDFCGTYPYSEKGLKLLSPKLKSLKFLDYSAEDLRIEAMLRATKMSIQGVQPKLSAVFNTSESRFEIVDKGGKYILKPQHHIFPELPQNEDVTMHLAESIGIEVPLHGLIYSKDESLTYFIKRFDRKGRNGKVAIEDFAQLAGMSRETKYYFSMEKIVKLIDEYCTFPAIEKAKLFKLVLFNFLVGNEDMHLKNYSIIVRKGKIELSPAYDLLNSTIVLKGDVEEIALWLNGKKRNLNQDILINYFGSEKCSLTDKMIERTISNLQKALPSWFDMLKISFLSDDMRIKYETLLRKRIDILRL
jgi:serine/threonine-protein kinase HipA